MFFKWLNGEAHGLSVFGTLVVRFNQFERIW